MKTQLLLPAAWITCLLPLFSLSQNKGVPGDRKALHETLGDKYLPNSSGNKKTSPAAPYSGSGVFTIQVNVNSSGQNILGDAGNEPNIAIDPTNPNKIIIGWRQFDNMSSNFRQNGWSYSSDAGQTWTFPGVIQPGIFRTDPVLDFDTLGNFYYNSLTEDSLGVYTCRIFKSTNGGAAWDTGTEARGGDKQWMAIDRTSGVGSGNIYCTWNSAFSSCLPGFFTRSADKDSSYEPCTVVDGDPYWGNMAIGNNGELYIPGGGVPDSIVVSKSVNAMLRDSVIKWDLPVQVYMDGYLAYSSPINPAGLSGQVTIDVDRSNGSGRDNVYLLAPLTRISNGDPGDIMFVKSTDGGKTWSSPVRVNDDPDPGIINTQWLGTMSVAPNGRIDAVWLDTRDAPSGTDISALYYSYSTDQGTTWSANEKLSDSFDEHVGYPNQNKMGDYFDMVSDSSGAHLAWANTLNGEEDVYYTHITPNITGIENMQGKNNYFSLSSYPNPFRSQTSIRYQVPEDNSIQLMICTIYGQEIATLVNKKQTAGSYEIPFTVHLPAGYYFCTLTAGSHSETIRLVILK